MRASLLLPLAFLTLLLAWIEVGGRAIHQAWTLYEAASEDYFNEPGRSVARNAGGDVDAARARFTRLYLSGPGAVIAESGASPRRP